MAEDRKLRPIYDAIEARNYKQSLKLCNSFLKKKDNQNQIVTALKALTLEKQGKAEEAEQLCQEVAKHTPSDENVLNTLFLVYKALGKLEEVSKLYENAYNKNPKNEDLLLGVFCSYVRRQEYLKQKEVTMKLQKIFPKDKYIMWMIQSTVLQVPLKESTNPLLQLAEKMFEQKIIQENKVKNLEGLQLYLDVLTQQQNHKKVLEVISGKLGEFYKLPEERLSSQAQLHVKLSQFQEAKDLYAKLFTDFDSDNWSYYISMFDASEKLFGQTLPLDQFVNDTKQLIQQLQQKNPEKRGPYLAELELQVRAAKGQGKDKLVWSQLEPLLVSYFKRFSTKFCCFSDLKPYLDYIPKEESAGFCEKLRSNINQETSKDPKTQVMDLLQLTTLEQIRRRLGLHDNLDENGKEKLVGELFQQYQSSANILPKEVTELSPGDNLLLLTSHLMRDIAFQKKDQISTLSKLLEVALILEHGLVSSKYSFHIKIFLISIYAYLGAIKPCLELYTSLEIKHILLDSLTYIILDDTIRLAHFDDAAEICEQIRHLHDDNKKNTSEYVIRAFTHESYSKIREFMEFKEKLERSNQLAVANTELLYLQLQKNDNSPLEAESFLRTTQLPQILDNEISKLESNEDYSVLVSWDTNESGASNLFSSTATTSAKKLGRTKQDQLIWLKMRGLIPHLLLSAIQGNQSSLSNHMQTFKSVLNDLKLLSDTKDELKGSFDQQNYDLIYSTFEISALFIDKAAILSGDEVKAEDDTAKRAQTIIVHSTKLLNEITKQFSQKFSFTLDGKDFLNGKTLSELSFFVTHTLSWLVLLLQTWIKAIPSGKKKKIPENLVAEVRNLVKELFNEIKNTLSELTRILTSQTATNINLTPLLKDQFNFEGVQHVRDRVLSNISASQRASVTRLLSVVNAKMNVIKAIRV